MWATPTLGKRPSQEYATFCDYSTSHAPRKSGIVRATQGIACAWRKTKTHRASDAFHDLGAIRV
jgi:hypothetical protein